MPKDELGRFFGLFSLSGRAAAAIGPLIWTTVVYYMRPDNYLGKWAKDVFNLSGADAETMPYRAGILSLAVMMAVGLYIFRKVPVVGTANSGEEEVNG